MESARFPTRFVGREAELAHLTTLLGTPDVRLVTLTGPGGVGKTRLAARIAGLSEERFPGGAWFVPLADVDAPARLLRTVAIALGIRESSGIDLLDAMAARLDDGRTLIVLDTFEHLTPEVTLVADLLARCPNLTLLVTSRQMLHLRGEHVVIVQPLRAVHSNPYATPVDLAEVDAIRLFIDRASAADAAFAMTEENAPSISEICERLDGIPLAIELVAARVRHASPRQLLAWIDRGLPLLSGGPRDAPKRQQTMRDAIAWSYHLLPASEQQLFRSLSVFAGGFDLAAAEGICAAPPLASTAPSVLDGVASLIDQSLVLQREIDGETRYSLLDPIRHFARDELASSGEERAIRLAHAQQFSRIALELRPAIEGPNAGVTLARLEREHPNLRAALAFSIDEEDAERSHRLVAALWKFWYVHRHISEMRAWSDRVLDLSDDVPAELRAEVLYAAGSVAAYQGDFAQGERLSQECLALARANGDRLHAGMALFALGTSARNQGRFDEAEAMYQEALASTTTVSGEISFGDHMCAMIDSSLGDMVFEKGAFPQAMALFDEAFAIWQRRGDAWGMAIALHNMAAVSLATGDLSLAAHRFRQSLTFYRDLGDEVGFSHSMTGLGIVAIRMGHAESAARLMGTAHEVRAKESIPIVRMMQADYEQALNQGRLAIGAERFDLAWEAGRSASLDQAFEDATTLSLTTPPARSAETPYGLTARELDVLRLIADGKSDQEIADELFISYRTVTTHVANIRSKLAVTSRTAAGAMALRLGII